MKWITIGGENAVDACSLFFDTYKREHMEIAFCPYRICPMGAHSDHQYGKVTGLVVREAHETVGLGNNALTDHEFLSQFLNSSGSFEIAVSGADAFSGATGTAEADSGESVQIDGITGATVTSKAIARSVNSAVGYVTGADAVSSATTWGG